MLAVLLTVMAYRARQLFKLGQWLDDARIETIPEAGGIWDDVFSQLYKMVKQHNQTKQELAAELQHIEQATSALPEGVAILNEANRIEWCNPLAEQHFRSRSRARHHAGHHLSGAPAGIRRVSA